jgi:hypothetical protein
MSAEKIMEKGADILDGASILAPIAVLMDFAPAILLLLTVPYLIYRIFAQREKFLRERAERLNAEANFNRSNNAQ